MSIGEIIMIGVGLSMDALAIALSNGMVYKRSSRHYLMPVFFGVFQALMPVAGYFIGGIFSDFIVRYSGILVCVILGALGLKMLKEGIWPKKEDREAAGEELTIKVLAMQAIATSIDAFAVGISFRAVEANILTSAALIGLTTATLCLIAMLLGRKFGDFLGSRAGIIGGAILIVIAVKALF